MEKTIQLFHKWSMMIKEEEIEERKSLRDGDLSNI